MKLTTLLIIASMLQLSAASLAQNVTLSKKNVRLSAVFKAIRKQTGYNILWKSKDLDASLKIDADFNNSPLDEVIKRCLADKALDYTVDEKTILITRSIQTMPSAPLAVANVDVSGKVLDDTGKGVAGATITIKGTAITTITNINGQFSLKNVNENAVVVVSYIGYTTVELPVSTNLTVKLTPKFESLNDVVVVGYGTQKKINLTGSVATVSGEEINKRPAPNAASLLQGKITGLDVVQSGSQPGRDGANFQIRGNGSFGAATSPLILIDGVIGDLNLISPNDIESVSVLKDAASAAIYGNRAANGVVLITTKKGKAGTATITYANNFSRNTPTRLPDLIYNSAQYMQMFNQASEHSGQPAVYTQAQIDAYKNAPANSKEYPNYNWIENFIKSSFTQNHNLGVSGGSENTTYNISLNYLKQNGIIPKTDYTRYNMLFNMESKLNNTFKVGGNVAFTKQEIKEPVFTNDDYILMIYGAAPTYSPFLADGSGRYATNDYVGAAGHNRNPLLVSDNGLLSTNNYQARSQLYLETNILKNLTWLVKGAFTYTDQLVTNYQQASAEYFAHPDAAGNYTLANDGGMPQIGVSNQTQRDVYLNAYSTLNYKTNFGSNHHLNALLGYSVENFTDQTLGAYRPVFPVTGLSQLNAGSTVGQSLNGNEFQYALLSTFGRLSYDYKGKYLLEFNGRYDGSSRISPDKRFGLFPSVSAGWRLNEEDFLKSADWLNNLKIRASYGRLGNQAIGNYPYQDILSLVNYSYNNSGTSQGVQVTRLTDKNLRWETTDIANLGIDFDIKGGLLSGTIDVYNKKTSGILSQPNILSAIGLGAPVTNFGTLQNRGFEVELNHTNKIGNDFRYAVNVKFSLNRNKVLQILESQDKGMYIDQVGQPYDSFYLTKWIGIFQSQNEINTSPQQQYNPKPGDLKFADANGDNKIDNNDRVIVKGLYPDYTYSFNLNFGYKMFDLSTFFQGVQGVKQYVSQFGIEPFLQGGPPPRFFENAWTPENQSQTVPALYVTGYAPVDATNSTYFLKDASYLRLKNVQLSYRLPQNVISKIKLKNLSVYVSGDNLVTFTKYPGDPERLQPYQSAPGLIRGPNTRYATYPQTRMLTAGLKAQF